MIAELVCARIAIVRTTTSKRSRAAVRNINAAANRIAAGNPKTGPFRARNGCEFAAAPRSVVACIRSADVMVVTEIGGITDRGVLAPENRVTAGQRKARPLRTG